MSNNCSDEVGDQHTERDQKPSKLLYIFEQKQADPFMELRNFQFKNAVHLIFYTT